MRFTEISLFDHYLAPISMMLLGAWPILGRLICCGAAFRNLLIKKRRKMRGYTMMLVGAVFASSLLTFAAEAPGQVASDGDRFGAAGGYIGVGGRSDKRDSSPRYRSTSQSGYRHYSSHCYFPEEWPKLPPWPPFCDAATADVPLMPPVFRRDRR